MVWRNILKNLKVKDKLTVEGALTGNYENFDSTGSGVATIRTGLLTLGGTGSGNIQEISLLAPTAAGQRLEVIDVNTLDTVDVVLKAGTGTEFSANSSGTGSMYTFNAPAEKLVLISSSTTVWQVVDNTGSITLS